MKSLPEIGREFEAKSGVKVVFSFGASGILAQQISGGAPFDAFFSADRRYIDQLIHSGHLDAGSRRTYAQGRLVVWSKSLAITRLEDLAGPEVRRISVANPDYAPYGRAARQALERAGLWDKLGPKLVVAENIRHALEMAESGNADAALTALSLMDKASGHLWIVPETLHDPMLQDAAVVARSAHRQQAEAFIEFLASPQARGVLEKYGFLLPR